jgi:quinol monooxygenase YgiN
MSVRLGALATLEAKPGKGDELASFLEKARALAVTEEGTVTWYAFKISDTSYGVFDTFETSDGLQAHIGGEILRALLRWHPDRTRHRAERRHCAPGTGLRRARAVTPGACSGVAHERAGPGAGGGQAHRLNRP